MKKGTHKEGEGLLELGDLLFGEGVSLNEETALAWAAAMSVNSPSAAGLAPEDGVSMRDRAQSRKATLLTMTNRDYGLRKGYLGV